MLLTAVTCSVGRPEMLALCRRYVDRQTCPPDEWILQEEDLPPLDNLISALRSVQPGSHVVVMEDDDWYGQAHIETLARALEGGPPLVAYRRSRQYNVPAGRWLESEVATPGPGSVGIHRDFVQRYAGMLTSPIGDALAWQLSSPPGLKGAPTVVSIKGIGYGLPGRPGANLSKHDPNGSVVRGWQRDRRGGLSKLKAWIGSDVDAYKAMLSSETP